MAEYDKAMKGLQQILDAIPQLELGEKERALVAHLVERTAFNVHNALMAAYGNFPLSADLITRMSEYAQLAAKLDPKGDYRRTLPILR